MDFSRIRPTIDLSAFGSLFWVISERGRGLVTTLNYENERHHCVGRIRNVSPTGLIRTSKSELEIRALSNDDLIIAQSMGFCVLGWPSITEESGDFRVDLRNRLYFYPSLMERLLLEC